MHTIHYRNSHCARPQIIKRFLFVSARPPPQSAITAEHPSAPRIEGSFGQLEKSWVLGRTFQPPETGMPSVTLLAGVDVELVWAQHPGENTTSVMIKAAASRIMNGSFEARTDECYWMFLAVFTYRMVHHILAATNSFHNFNLPARTPAGQNFQRDFWTRAGKGKPARSSFPPGRFSWIAFCDVSDSAPRWAARIR